MELPLVHPKKAFMIGALDKEIRLSFAQRIRGTLPEPYQSLISEAKEKDTPDFKYNDDRESLAPLPCMLSTNESPETPYAAQGREIMALIRKKAPEDTIQPLLDQIQEEAATHGISDPLVPSTDAYVTCICFIGSKSLSHVLSCIERCKDRLLAIGPASGAARRQIITSVMNYWKEQPGIGVNIVDKLLNYTILTPMAVVEWALMENIEAGRVLVHAWVYEMLASTVGKVTNRVRQIVAARNQPGLPGPQVAMLDETLSKERAEQSELFRVIEDALAPVAAGSQDQMVEGGDGWSEEEGLVRAWGERWLRVFRRKGAVEEAFIQEAVVGSGESGDGGVGASNGVDVGDVL